MNFKIIDLIFPILILVLVSIYFSFYSLNVDSTWILYSANEIINGARLYVDIVDVNPPLIFIYAMISALFSNLTLLTLEHTYILFVLILIYISIFLTSKVLNDYNLKNKKLSRYYLYTISIILSISITSDFGQREHLFMIFIMPYIIMMLFKDKIKLSSLNIYFIAIFASLGFNLKPHFFLIFISIEFVYMFYSRSVLSIFRKEALIIISSGFLYLLMIFTQFPEYISFIIPLAVDTYTNLFNKSYYFLLLRHDIFLLLFTILFWLMFTEKKINYQIIIFLSIIISSIIIYLVQQKGWAYHRIPILIITLLFLSYITINLLNKSSKFFVIGFVPMILFLLIVNIQSVPKFSELQSILKNLDEGSKIHIISADIARGQALLVENNQIWTSRFPSLFVLPSLLQKENKKIENYLFEAIYEDLKKYEPDTIIFCGKYTSFNYYNYFSNKDPKLKEVYETYYKKSIIDGYTVLSRNKNLK